MLHRIAPSFRLTQLERLHIETLAGALAGAGLVEIAIEAKKYFFPSTPISTPQCLNERNIQTAAEARSSVASCNNPRTERLDEIDIALQVIQNFNIVVGSVALTALLCGFYHRGL